MPRTVGSGNEWGHRKIVGSGWIDPSLMGDISYTMESSSSTGDWSTGVGRLEASEKPATDAGCQFATLVVWSIQEIFYIVALIYKRNRTRLRL